LLQKRKLQLLLDFEEIRHQSKKPFHLTESYANSQWLDISEEEFLIKAQSTLNQNELKKELMMTSTSSTNTNYKPYTNGKKNGNHYIDDKKQWLQIFYELSINRERRCNDFLRTKKEKELAHIIKLKDEK